MKITRINEKKIEIEDDQPIFTLNLDEHNVMISFKPVKSVKVEWH